MTTVPLRVHFAAVDSENEAVPGSNHANLVVQPALDLRADELHLLQPIQGAGEPTIRFLEEVGRTKTTVHVHHVDFEDAAAAASTVGRIIEGYSRHDSFLYNVSSGPRASAIVAFLAAQFWPIQAFRAHVDKLAVPDPDTNEWPYSGSTPLPAPPRHAVGAGSRACLELLGGQTDVKQRQLIVHLKKKGIIAPATISPQAANSQFLVHAKELARLGFAEKMGHGRHCSWKATPEGRTAARVLLR